MNNDGTLNPLVSGSSPERVTFRSKLVTLETRKARFLDWVSFPDWLTLDQACFLTGWNADQMNEIIRENGVDLDDAGLIEKQSLYEFQGALADALSLAPSTS